MSSLDSDDAVKAILRMTRLYSRQARAHRSCSTHYGDSAWRDYEEYRNRRSDHCYILRLFLTGLWNGRVPRHTLVTLLPEK